MEIYKKIKKCRQEIAETKMKKTGKNKFSNYDYFTPEQITFLVNAAAAKNGIIEIFSLKADEFGFFGELKVVNIDKPEEVLIITQRTAIPQIKATNETQQIGGAVTYTYRYMLMSLFRIADNNLDFDTTENTKKQSKKEVTWLSEVQYEAALNCDVISKIENVLVFYAREGYGMKAAYKAGLEARVLQLKNKK